MKFDLTGWRDRYPALRKNLTDMVTESQIKLGYAQMPTAFYYPVESLERLLGMEPLPDARADLPDADRAYFAAARLARMQGVLEDFAAENADRFGQIGVSHNGERFCLRVSAEGARIIHETVPQPAFLVELIRCLEGHPSEEALLDVFRRHGEGAGDHGGGARPGNVVTRRIGGEFDLLVYFGDGEPDDYRYCLKFEGEPGPDGHRHVIFHRFTPADYEALGIGPGV